MGVKRDVFGVTKEGETACLYTLENQNGTRAVLSDFGAVLVSLFIKDGNGTVLDVVLGYDSLEQYFVNGPGFGATIGRHANRIKNGSFQLNGERYQLSKNDGNNNLHSNPQGYHKRLWEAETGMGELGAFVTFSLHSPDGDQGFPGNADVQVTYTLTEDDALMLHYQATSDQDTVLNLTNHSYFNLSGHQAADALNQKVWINADQYTEADSESIPTGEYIDVSGTPMDFRILKTIEEEIDSSYEAIVLGGGYDHNWVLNNHGEMGLAAKLTDENSKLTMEVYTDLPGMQFYTGNFLNGSEKGKDGVYYQKRSGVCFETQYFPDAVNHDNFPSPILKAFETYETITIYKFTR